VQEAHQNKRGGGVKTKNGLGYLKFRARFSSRYREGRR